MYGLYLKLSSAIVLVMGLSACGGSSSGGDSQESEVELKLVGIPSAMVSKVCFDIDMDNSCDGATEEALFSRNDGNSAIYSKMIAQPPYPPVIIEILDPTKSNFYETTVLSFPGGTTELSMRSLLDVNKSGVLEQDLEGRDAFLAHLNNLNLLGANGMLVEDANEASLSKIKAKIDMLSNEDIDALSKCSGCWIEILSLSKKQVYEIAKEGRGDDKSLVGDAIIKDFVCGSDEVKSVKYYGLEDLFDQSNGVEYAYPSAGVLANTSLASFNTNVGSGFVDYDEVSDNRQFAENIHSLPSNITSGMIVIGFESDGNQPQGNDAVYIGDYGTHVAGDPSMFYSQHIQNLTSPNGTWSSQLASNTNPTTAIYSNSFSALNFIDGNMSLLDYVQTNNQFDVLVQDDTSVDFITVATCSKKDPVVEIEQILERFECKPEIERRVTVTGGTVDAFASATDAAATPSTALVSAAAIGYPPGTTGYDALSYDRALIDTLTLPSWGYIATARLSIGIRPLDATALYSNDRVYLGYTDPIDIAVFDLYGSGSSSVNTLWSVSAITGGERVIQTDFSGVDANSLSWLRVQSYFDLMIQDDTSVDFVQLDLCMLEKPPFVDTDSDGFSDDEENEAGSDSNNSSSTPNDLDGDGTPNESDCDPLDPDLSVDCEPALPDSCKEQIEIDLRPAASWINVATSSSPVENNVFSTYQPNPAWANVIWDGAMNWFDFGSASNTDHLLKIDFCACGGGEIKIDQMKSDNYGWIYLNSNSPSNLIVERTVHSQSTMASWGTDVNGSLSFPYSGNGVDHTLYFKVHNVGGPSGGSVNGTLSFVGHRGACNATDVLTTSP